MAEFIVQGGNRLKGEIVPQGAKNEALQIICATLLTPERVTLHNVPEIVDILQLMDMLRAMGVEVEKTGPQSYAFRARDIDLDYIRSEDYRRRGARLRGSVMVIGPLLARFGIAYLPKPGGDKIGRRRLDTHLIGFQKLGAKFDYDFDNNYFALRSDGLRGTYMLLDEASVTGTANIVMAAVLARGETTIYNAAANPTSSSCADARSHGSRHPRYRFQPADHPRCGTSRRNGAHHAAGHDRNRQLHRNGGHDAVGDND